MDLPFIETPIFPRWVWVEEFTFSHIPIAGIITAWMFLAPILEWYGYRMRDLRYDRLSKSLVYFCMILFSPGAALGTGIVFLLIGLYPEFWHRWAGLFFWPLIFQFIMFLLEVVFLFNMYYLNWDKMAHKKGRHIVYGFIAAGFGELIQLTWDAIGSYMLTPNRPFPMIAEKVGVSWRAFANPSWLPLFVHRSFGNLSWSLLLAGAVLFIHQNRVRTATEKHYYNFAADKCFTLGFLFFIPQPFVGFWYSRVIRDFAPVAFHAVMGGHAWYYWIPKMLLIVLFVIIAGTYVFVRHRDKLPLLGAATVGLASFYFLFSAHPALDWVGTPVMWRLTGTFLSLAFLGYLWLTRWKGYQLRIPGWKALLLIAGLSSTLVFALGGNIRSRVRSPTTVYAQYEKPEATDYERDRFLTYQRCLDCHLQPNPHRSARDLKLPAGETWSHRVGLMRTEQGVQLTDDEARRIVSYLQEAKP